MRGSLLYTQKKVKSGSVLTLLAASGVLAEKFTSVYKPESMERSSADHLLQQSQTQLFSLKAVKAADPAMGSFVVNLGQRQGILAIQNLVAPPRGKVYRLWAIADGEKIPCGTLNTNSQGKVLEKFWMPADFYDQGISGLFVTVESSETSRYPTGASVMQSTLATKI